jgi:hypothetical protein
MSPPRCGEKHAARPSRIAPMKKPEYWVYENYPSNKAVGHLSTCGYFKLNGGHALKTGKWYGPFDNRSAAASLGNRTGRPFHWCKRCYWASAPRPSLESQMLEHVP